MRIRSKRRTPLQGGPLGRQATCLTLAVILVVGAIFVSCANRSGGTLQPNIKKMKGESSNMPASTHHPVVEIITSMGSIKIELYPNKAPITVENFLKYANSGFYDGTIFHRVIPGFMIQGGGFDSNMSEKKTNPPIKNEAGNGLTNDEGTIAMARTGVVDSATAQFFINAKNNPFLNHKDNTPQGFGYAVFGKVIEGMEVVHKIEHTPTHSEGMYEDVPVTPVKIESVKTAEPVP